MAVEGGELLAGCPGRIYLHKDPRYPFYRRLNGPQSRLDTEVEEKSSAFIEDYTSVAQSIASHYTDSAVRLTTGFKHITQNSYRQ
jgi:hypothetical protein